MYPLIHVRSSLISGDEVDIQTLPGKKKCKKIITGGTLKIDWHSSLLTRATNVDKNYKNTQNVRRFMIKACGDDFRFDREFMAWIRNDVPKTLGDVVYEWKRRQSL